MPGTIARFGAWLAAALLATTALSAEKPAAQAPQPVLVMEDQFGQVHRLEDHRGNVVILVYSDRTGAEASRALGERLHLLFHPTARGLPPREASRAPTAALPDWPDSLRQPEVHVIAVACIADISGPAFSGLRSYIQGRFREVAPEVPVWLDMADQLKKQCGLKAKVPNVAVFDIHGRLRLTKAGSWAEADVQHLQKLVTDLSYEALRESRAKSDQKKLKQP